MAEVRMRGVSKRFGKVRVIENVDLDIAEGEFAVFVGPSGCGKSTLLRLVAGLEEVSAGELVIGGKNVTDLPPAERGVAMVFQSYALYPHMSVYENMAFGLRLVGGGESVGRRVRRAAEILQLGPLLERLPKELSGGQRQRVAIGRAIVREPGVFLFDEPLSNLDAALRVKTRVEIARLHARLGGSMIYVTHDQVEAMTLADRIVLLNTGPAVTAEGSVAQAGPPLELYHHPRNRFVAGFIGSPTMNFLSAELLGAEPGRAGVRLANGAVAYAAVDAAQARPGDPVTLGIRPEHIVCVCQGTANGVLTGTVSHVERLGEASYIYLRVSGERDWVTVRKQGDPISPAVCQGEPLTVTLPAQSCHLFDAQGRAYRRRRIVTGPAGA